MITNAEAARHPQAAFDVGRSDDPAPLEAPVGFRCEHEALAVLCEHRTGGNRYRDA
jgi:hypothetical protein